MGELICGETLEELKKLDSDFIDLSVTSPPYNKKVGANKGWLVKEVKYKNYNDKVKESIYQQNQIEVLNEVFRVTKPGGSFFYNHKLRWEKGIMFHPLDWLRRTNWLVRQEIIWNRKMAGNIRGWRFWNIDERVYWLYKPVGKKTVGAELKSKHALLTSIWEIMPERNNPHPAPFPIDLPTRIIHSFLDEESGIVLDPYCGSGTTMLSANLLGKDFLGIDICQEYLDLTNERLKNPPNTDIARFEKEMSLHKVEKTFKQRKEEGLWNKKKNI